MVDVEVVNSIFETHLSLVIWPNAISRLGCLCCMVVKVNGNGSQEFYILLVVAWKLRHFFEF